MLEDVFGLKPAPGTVPVSRGRAEPIFFRLLLPKYERLFIKRKGWFLGAIL